MKKTIASQVKNFFEIDTNFDIDIAFVRNDGIILYSNVKDQKRSGAVGALVGGVWQASRSLANFVSDQDFFNFRLSFDTSSDGVLILPIKISNKEYLLFGMYKNVYNPAVIRQKLKVLRMRLEEFIVDEPDEDSVSKQSEYLFSNITDEEMDNLFNNFRN